MSDTQATQNLPKIQYLHISNTTPGIVPVETRTDYVFRDAMIRAPSKVPGPTHNVVKDGILFKGKTTSLVKPSNVAKSNKYQYGSAGKATSVIANYLTLEFKGSEIFHYSIQFSSDIRTREEKTRILDSFQRDGPISDTDGWAFDLNNIWSVRSLFTDIDTLSSDNINYNSLNGSQKQTSLTVKFERILDVSHGSKDLFSQPDATSVLSAINAFISQRIIAYQPKNVTQIRNKFYVTAGYENIDGLLATRGYFISARPGQDRILLNINTATSVFFEPMLVSEWIVRMQQSPFLMRDRDIQIALRGKRVRLTYDRPKLSEELDPNAEANRRRRIAELGKPLRAQTFPNGEARSYVWKWFKSDLSQFRYPDLPCINVGRHTARDGNDDGSVWIPPELLELDLNQLFTCPLTTEHTTRMLRYACRNPASNANLIDKEGMALLGIKGNAAGFDQFQLNINENLSCIDARILATPAIKYQTLMRHIKNASWNLINIKFAQPGNFDDLRILQIRISGQASPPAVDIGKLRQKLSASLKGHAIRYSGRDQQPAPTRLMLPPSREAGRQTLKMTAALQSKGTRTISLVILPTKNVELYAAVKKYGDCLHGMRTVCCVAGTVCRMADQYLSNLALKFNFKSGGINHNADPKTLGQLYHENAIDTLIIGADVTHPSQGSTSGCPSIAAVVGSIDGNLSNMHGSMRLQCARQEIIENLNEMVVERLEAYAEANKRLPGKIIMYRDGVSESQFKAVQKYEVFAIKTAYQDAIEAAVEKGIKAPSSFKLSFYVVSKRHHTRFFAADAKDTYNQRGNIKPGLLVDKTVTLPERCNFYLQSHDALQGTARPAHYIEIVNEINFTADEIQALTHTLCYTYARATKGVSYATPAYYADRLCERGRMYLREYLTGEMPDETKPNEKPKARDSRMASEIQDSKFWRMWLDDPNVRDGIKKTRKNPWHPSFDKIMFWL